MPDLPEAIAEADNLASPESTVVFLGRMAVQLVAMGSHAGGIIATSDLHRLLSMAHETHALDADLSTTNVRITALECSLKILKHDVQAYAARTGDAVLWGMITGNSGQ